MPFQKGNKLGKKFESGVKHWNWKGGYKYYKSGSGKQTYRQIKIDGKWVVEHRYIMEQHLGRKLEKSEIVHHKDGNGINNKIENLEIMSWGKHNKKHGIDRRKYKNFMCSCGRADHMARGLCARCYSREYSRKVNKWKRKYIRKLKVFVYLAYPGMSPTNIP